MRKALEIIKMGTKLNIADRSQVLFWVVLSSLGLIIKLLIWTNIYQTGYSIGTYSFKQMFTYSLVVFFLNRIQMSAHWRVGHHIKSGRLSSYLMRPFDYTKYIFLRSFGSRIFGSTLISLPAYAVLIFIFSRNLLPPANLMYSLILALTLPLALVLGFLIKYILGLVGFWTTEIGGFYFLIYTLTNFAGGTFVPVDAFPPLWRKILQNLPFQYLYTFPGNIYLGRLSSMQILQGLALMLGWIGVFSLISYILWTRGLKRYEAYGG